MTELPEQVRFMLQELEGLLNEMVEEDPDLFTEVGKELNGILLRAARRGILLAGQRTN